MSNRPWLFLHVRGGPKHVGACLDSSVVIVTASERIRTEVPGTTVMSQHSTPLECLAL